MSRYQDYDPFAWLYNRRLGPASVQQFLPVVEQLVLSHCEPGARILDVCCGTGQLAQALARRGYQVAGVDGSREMLRYARINAPEAEFIAEDARSFDLPATCRAAISAFDSLNHVMHLQELTRVFENVYACLEEEGRFLFDLNMEKGYRARWCASSNIVEDDHVAAITHRFDEDARIGTATITIFRLEAGTWSRSDVTLLQRCYSEEEVTSALRATGFIDIQTHDARDDFGWTNEVGRMFFACRKGADR